MTIQPQYRFDLELGGAVADEEVPTTYTGGVFEGVIRLEFLQAMSLQALVLSLRYTVSGAGSPEVHELVRRTIGEGTFGAHSVLERQLMLVVPELMPISYEGTYIKIHWSLSLLLQRNPSDLMVENIPLIVKARPMGWQSETLATRRGDMTEARIEVSQHIDRSTQGCASSVRMSNFFEVAKADTLMAAPVQRPIVVADPASDHGHDEAPEPGLVVADPALSLDTVMPEERAFVVADPVQTTHATSDTAPVGAVADPAHAGLAEETQRPPSPGVVADPVHMPGSEERSASAKTHAVADPAHDQRPAEAPLENIQVADPAHQSNGEDAAPLITSAVADPRMVEQARLADDTHPEDLPVADPRTEDIDVAPASVDDGVEPSSEDSSRVDEGSLVTDERGALDGDLSDDPGDG